MTTERPASARIYDYLLGGTHFFPPDQAVGDQLNSVAPFARMARLNREFLQFAVTTMVERGIHQFVDLGSGIPSTKPVHEVAPDAMVVYVDNDPIAVRYSKEILDGNPRADIVDGDLRDPAAIFDSPQVRQLIDLDAPVGLLLLGVVQYIPDSGDPAGLIARYVERLPPGSMLALTHFTQDNNEAEMAAAVEFFSRTASPMTPRRHAEVAALVAGLDLLPPGVEFTARWLPGHDEPERCGHYAVIAIRG
jgi:O-methyltransferase involved in polyketide biosynthesis